jgi:hypothetical protein
MTIKREAAYHEAAHAVVTYHSRFHALVGPINLAKYGQGEIFISLSKSKLNAGGKPATPDARYDREVVNDFALILTAGYVAEQLAAESDETLKPNLGCAMPDHELLRQQLSAAGMSTKFDRAEADVREVLKSKWDSVERLANFLYEKCEASVDQILAVIAA